MEALSDTLKDGPVPQHFILYPEAAVIRIVRISVAKRSSIRSVDTDVLEGVFVEGESWSIKEKPAISMKKAGTMRMKRTANGSKRGINGR